MPYYTTIRAFLKQRASPKKARRSLPKNRILKGGQNLPGSLVFILRRMPSLGGLFFRGYIQKSS
jgi:hypothetical protein